MLRTAMLSCAVVLAAVPAFAQSKSSDPPPADFKPLLQPILPPLVLPPNSYITPGAITGDPGHALFVDARLRRGALRPRPRPAAHHPDAVNRRHCGASPAWLDN